MADSTPGIKILHNIIQHETIHYQFIVNTLSEFCGHTGVAFFEVISQESGLVKCKYSNRPDFNNDDHVFLSQFSEDDYQLFMFTKDTLIGVLLFINGTAIENMSDVSREHLKEVICIGLLIEQLKTRQIQISTIFHEEVFKMLKDIYDLNNLSPRYVDPLNAIFSILIDIRRYLDLESNVTSSTVVQCDLSVFLLEQVKNPLANTITVTINIDARVPRYIRINTDHLEYILVSIVKRLSPCQPIIMRVSVVSMLEKNFLLFEIAATQPNSPPFTKIFSDHFSSQININYINSLVIRGLVEKKMAGTFQILSDKILVKIRLGGGGLAAPHNPPASNPSMAWDSL